jgi:hypothetical protein
MPDEIGESECALRAQRQHFVPIHDIHVLAALCMLTALRGRSSGIEHCHIHTIGKILHRRSNVCCTTE